MVFGLISRLVATSLIASTALVFSSSSSLASVNPAVPMEYSLPICASSTDLDCLVDVQVKHIGGATELAELRYLRGSITSAPDTVSRDPSYYSWRFHSGTKSGPVITMNGVVNLTSPSAWEVFKQPGRAIPVLHVGMNGDFEQVDARDYFTITIRTSWLVPLDLSMYARDAASSMRSIPGGREWKFSGSKTVQSSFNDNSKYADLYGPNSETTKADLDRPAMYWRLDHVSSIPNGSAFDTSCSQYGYTVTSSNASSAGMPSMQDAETLAFNIAAPHFRANGKENTGYFLADLPLRWIDCKFPGNTLTQSPRVEVSVTNSDGVNQLAVSTVEISNQTLLIRASGFHYSAPKILVRGFTDSKNTEKMSASKSSPSPSPAHVQPVQKIKKISCVKGNSKKTVSAFSPKCPQGWKLASK